MLANTLALRSLLRLYTAAENNCVFGTEAEFHGARVLEDILSSVNVIRKALDGGDQVLLGLWNSFGRKVEDACLHHKTLNYEAAYCAYLLSAYTWGKLDLANSTAAERERKELCVTMHPPAFISGILYPRREHGEFRVADIRGLLKSKMEKRPAEGSDFRRKPVSSREPA